MMISPVLFLRTSMWRLKYRLFLYASSCAVSDLFKVLLAQSRLISAAVQ
jgi:hypothetical protein